MRRLHANGFDVADSILQGLARLGYWLTPGTKILDLGCGEGGLVYRFRELGYDAHGFDIHRRVQLRKPDDEAFFRFLVNPEADTSVSAVAWPDYRLPFPAQTFELVVSTSTLEHVLNVDAVMAEAARVLRPDGIGLHLYPGRNALIEPHMFVPFGTLIQTFWWFYMWSFLGLRNEYQKELTTRQAAESNFRYCKSGVLYLTRYEMRLLCGRYFRGASFVEEAYHPPRDWKATRLAIWRALMSGRTLADLAAIPRLWVLLTVEPKEALGAAVVTPASDR